MIHRFLTIALACSLAACGSTVPKSFHIDVSGPDAMIGNRRRSTSGYDAIVECSWSVSILARGGQAGDVAQIIGSRLEVVAPGFRTIDEFDSHATARTVGAGHDRTTAQAVT